MSKTSNVRYPVVIRDGKLYVEDRELIFWGDCKMVNGRIQSCGHDFSPRTVHPIGFADESEKFKLFKLQMCESCKALFVSYWQTSRCGHCMDISDARAKKRAITERSAQRRAKRAEAKCAACGKPIVGRQRGSGDRPAYCSSACRQWTYRRRKQTIAEPQASTSGIPFPADEVVIEAEAEPGPKA